MTIYRNHYTDPYGVSLGYGWFPTTGDAERAMGMREGFGDTAVPFTFTTTPASSKIELCSFLNLCASHPDNG